LPCARQSSRSCVFDAKGIEVNCGENFGVNDFDAFGNKLDYVGVVPPAMFDLGFSLSSK